MAREKDIALELKAISIRTEGPIPGEGVVGIELPNTQPSLVRVGNILFSSEYESALVKQHLPIALGISKNGAKEIADLASFPHLLVAGATGSGKSVFMNSIITSLIVSNEPKELRLVLIDPKQVEFGVYEGLPHLACPVVTQPDDIKPVLLSLLEEMATRYKMLSRFGYRNLGEYNHNQEPLPYIVVAIDEAAELLLANKEQMEPLVVRFAQMGRAAGIHLILATQRPTVDVVTGLIKANFPSRIAMTTASSIDSRVILDRKGAETLLGRGDLLFLSSDSHTIKRLQGSLVDQSEITALVNWWKSKVPTKVNYLLKPEQPPRKALLHESLQEPVNPFWVYMMQDWMEKQEKVTTQTIEQTFHPTCGLDSIWQDLLDLGWINRQGVVQKKRVGDLLVRGGYGGKKHE